MDFRILGPLEVRDDDRTVGLGGDKQRALLAILLLHRNEVVSADALIDDLWGERLPPAALKALQAHISRLRKALDHHRTSPLNDHRDSPAAAKHEVLITHGHGYLLRVAPGELDLDRFRDLVEEGRQALAAGKCEEAARVLRAGLALWRGPPLADFTYEPFAQPAIAQLEELHLGALEERVAADLSLGSHRDLVSELTALVERHPLRERLRAQLMLALHRSGRQAEALEVYQGFRRAMSEQLGLGPGPALQQLEQAILTRDASLEPQAIDGAPSASTGRSRGWLRPMLDLRSRLALGGSTLIAIGIAIAILLLSGGGAAVPPVLVADSVGAIDPARGAISAAVPVGSSPSELAAGDGAVWVANYNASTVSRINPATRAVAQTIPVGSAPSGIAVGAGAVWVANNFGGTVSRIDPAAGRVVQTIAVGNGPGGVAVGNGSVWVTNASDGTLSRIDPTTGTMVETIALGGGATDVAAGLGGVWVSDAANGRVLRVDPSSLQVVAAINVGTGPDPITICQGSVWVANRLDGTVSRIDPQTNQVEATIPVGSGPSAIAAGAGGVWVANEFAGSVAHIEPTTGEVRTVKVGNRPLSLAVAGGQVWVGTQSAAARHRGGTLTVLQRAPFGSSDPVAPGSLAALLTLHMTNDGLISYEQVGGTDGGRLVPDLAISLPTPTDGDRTYTFRLRPGIRYSNGAPVRPEDFRRAIERNLVVNPGANSISGANYTYYESILGGAECLARPARCDLSRGIVTDDKANTVTFHLVRPDPEFLARLAVWSAVAVPPGTPNHNIGTHPLPATGPYEIVSNTSRRVTLARNPYFHEWSHAAQPDGYADRIVWRTGASREAAVTAVERARADYTLDPPPPDRLGEVQTRFASQLNIYPKDVTIQLGLNTRVAPFNDLRVRRALNYAVDRAELARLFGRARPTCQMLPPYIPGYKPYCPYTLSPNKAGTWSAPDLTTAQALIVASHTRGTPITIWSPPGFTTAGRHLVSLLHQLGYPASIKVLDANDLYAQFGDSRTKAQAFFEALGPSYPSASEFLNPVLQGCQGFVPGSTSNVNLTEFCDPQFDAIVRSALAAEGSNSPTATALWAKADRRLTDQAPFVNLATPSMTDFVARRVGNYQYNPQLGVLIDQLWVR
jgi:peptide/nickel transport system substrate-binding protein